MLRRAAVSMITFYRRWISPLKPRSCRFYPSCSAYCQEAIERHGLLQGGILSALRLLRCGPWHPGGYDPVPSAVNWLNGGVRVKGE